MFFILVGIFVILLIILVLCDKGIIKVKEVVDIFILDNFDIKELGYFERKKIFYKVDFIDLNSIDYIKNIVFELLDEKDFFLKVYLIIFFVIDENIVVFVDKDKEVSVEIKLEFRIVYKDFNENIVELVDGWNRKLSIKNDKFVFYLFNLVYNSFENNKINVFEFKNIDWNKLKVKYFDVEIVEWSDGDIFIVKVIVIDFFNIIVKVGEKIKIRIFGIDIFEKFVGGNKSKDFEYNYVKLFLKFVEEVVLKGLKVRVYVD